MENRTALQFLNRDYLLNVSMIEPIKCGTADVLFATEECAFVRDKDSGVYMLETDDLALANKLLDVVGENDALVTHNKPLTDLAVRKLGFEEVTTCYQATYLGEKFDVSGCEISVRLMREDEAGEACEMYGFSPSSALHHIRKGLVYGAYLSGVTVGMVGMHVQGTMGMLEVKPDFRRRGYAEYMEKLLINRLIDEKKVPYCQIIEDNTASLALQSKLGLKLSRTLIYWLHKKRVE